MTGSIASTVDPLASRLPVTVITGFLGSGKTTLLSRLLRHPGMDRAAVIINEFGEAGIDHELVESSSEQTTLLGNGCLCCTLRTDLQETLRDLFVRRRAGEVIDFDRVFVETTGLADPVPVLHTLKTDGLLGAQYRLDGVATTVDAVNGPGQIDTMPEATKQIAVADRLIVTKTDLVDADAIEELQDRLAAINPFALRVIAVDGEIDPGVLAHIGPRSLGAQREELNRWLMPSDDRTPAVTSTVWRHDSAIRSFCLRFHRPFTWESLDGALQALSRLRGPDLLRVKGIIRVHGEPGPVVIQGAQHLFHPPVTLRSNPDIDAGSRIVFIVRNITRESIESLFAAVEALGIAH